MPKHNSGIIISGGSINAGALAVGTNSRAVQSPAPGETPVPDITHGIFLSYRRRDSKAYAGRIRDGIRTRLRTPAELFMDLDSIEGGEDFVVAIDQALKGSRVLLAVIGPSWLTVAGLDGRPRLEDPNDLVRHEVARGLSLGLKVIPVLVDGARMPDANQLPEPLVQLARRNAVELSDSRWDHDLTRLLEAVASI
jgi:TIR domain